MRSRLSRSRRCFSLKRPIADITVRWESVGRRSSYAELTAASGARDTGRKAIRVRTIPAEAESKRSTSKILTSTCPNSSRGIFEIVRRTELHIQQQE